MLDVLLTRRNLILASSACAVALGAAAWLLLGPLWAIAGVLAGLFVPPVVYGVGTTYFSPSPAALLAKGRPEDALSLIQREEASSRRTARAWPGQFREMLAYNLIVKSDALHALHRDRQALGSADEGVAIYQALASDKPAKYSPYLSRAIDTRSRALAGLGRQAEAIAAIETAIRMFRSLAVDEPDEYLPVLAEALTCMAEWLADIDNDADALTAAREATSIYWHKLPGPELPVYAARAALLAGRLLCRQARYHEAASLLARGWNLATSQQQRYALSTAAPALKTVYHVNPDDFTTVWHAETGSKPPDWLTS
jgi:tetratricopeptide (TPR) repeat protein